MKRISERHRTWWNNREKEGKRDRKRAEERLKERKGEVQKYAKLEDSHNSRMAVAGIVRRGMGLVIGCDKINSIQSNKCKGKRIQMNADIERNAFGVFYGNISPRPFIICRIISNRVEICFIFRTYFCLSQFISWSLVLHSLIRLHFFVGYNGNG